MASKSCLYLLCFVSCIVLMLSEMSESHPATRNLERRLERRSGIRLCGRMLVDTLATLCQSEYYAPEQHHHGKRNHHYYDDDALTNAPARQQKPFPESSNSWESNSYEEEAENELVKPQNAFDDFYLPKTKNPVWRRGVADECCVKSCSIAQLSSYCGRNPGK